MKIRLPNGFTPRPYQTDAMAYLDQGGTRAVEVWPRRAGKDMTMVHQAAKSAFRRVGLYMHMLPTHKQARKVVWDAIDNDGKPVLKTAFPEAIVASRNETEMKVTFKNGSIWQLVGADYYDGLVGTNPVGITMSEAALTDPAAWNYMRPILAANGGWAAFISTPRGKNWFWKLLQTAKSTPSWHWSHHTATELKHIPLTALEDERREMPDELYRQEYLCDFSAANVGAIFGKWMETMEREGRITHDVAPASAFEDLVISSDLGRRDKATFIWWRPMRGGAEIVHYDEATGLDAEEWIERLREQPKARAIWLPHDARVKTFQTRHSVIEQFLSSELAEEVNVNPVSSKRDQINAGRKMLGSLRIRKSDETAPLVEALMAYHYKWDDEQRIFSQEPDHDWSSHAADAFMGGSQVLRDVLPVAEKRTIAPVTHNRVYNLDDLWARCGPSTSRRI